MLSPQAAQGLGDKGQLSPSSPASAEGGRSQGWGRGSARHRVSVKRSREGEPTWAAAGPDGARSLALIKGRVAAIVGGPGLRGHLLRLPVGKETARGPGLAGAGRAGQGEERLDPPSSASHHVSCYPSPDSGRISQPLHLPEELTAPAAFPAGRAACLASAAWMPALTVREGKSLSEVTQRGLGRPQGGVLLTQPRASPGTQRRPHPHPGRGH